MPRRAKAIMVSTAYRPWCDGSWSHFPAVYFCDVQIFNNLFHVNRTLEIYLSQTTSKICGHGSVRSSMSDRHNKILEFCLSDITSHTARLLSKSQWLYDMF
jgi:hypothetical protein